MKFLFDLLAVLLFFGAYLITKDIYIATEVAMVTAALQVGFVYLRHRKVETMLLISSGMILVLGALTLYLHNPLFIKFKPTAVYWLFAIVLGGSWLLRGKNLIKLMLEKQLAMPDLIWTRLNWAWATFFLLLGVLNLFVALRFTEAQWVNFKAYGTTGLIFAFAIAQSIYLARHVQELPGQTKE
ncbi:intracellular septation protein [Andreprevotia lacus DSM 23236]|jgi:intracellular septation protein|uniref:Inner membrane-spanning protein YciB n=1 Tax=Andreprevotia lacus DSM 23236 TaxID=1121001 RepID=A0A1W1XWI8_9NEIS|nr:septation protein A [Andreprevotia lacus]SMC28296.1 intracellular septation protein [Andreprevotia lacus DSM 23236]